MYPEKEVQQEANMKAFEGGSPLVCPQLCGSWPGDEWPEDILLEQRGNSVDLCAVSHVEYARAAWPDW